MMRKNFKGLVAATALAGAFAAAPAQAAFLENWFLDFDGAGAAGKTQINEFLDIVGPSVVTTTVPNGGGNFTFSEMGAVNVTQHDGGVPFGAVTANNQIAALFDISGNGTLGGTINYTGGTISVYHSAGGFATAAGTYGVNPPGSQLIATFTPTIGSGLIDPTGIPNGQQTISAAATFLAAGFFFGADGTTDLSTLVGGPTPLLFGFATTNASFVANPNALIATELGDGSVSNCLPGQITATCSGAGEFVISNNGQFRLQVIPEPGTLALLGISLLGLGLAYRRKA